MDRSKSRKYVNKVSRWFTVPDNDTVSQPASYKTMLRYAEKYDYFLLTFGLIASVINGAILPVSSLAFRGMVNTLTRGQAEYIEGVLDKDALKNGMIFFAIMYLVVAVVTFILTFCSTASMYTLCERQVHVMRKKFLASILNQDMEWFDNNEIGALTHKMSSNIEKIKDGASDKITIFIQSFGALTSGICISLSLNWQLTLMNLVIVPFVIFSLYGSAKALSAAIHQEMSVYSAAGAIAEEVLNGIKTVTSFNAQPFEVNRYKKCLRKGKTVGIRKAAITAFFAGLYMLIMFGAMAVSFYYGAMLVIASGIEPGTVFACFWAILIGAMRMGQAVPQINVIIGAKAAAGELFEIIDRKPTIDCSDPSGVVQEDLQGRIEFKNVEFSYPKRREVKVLKGVSFSVEPGQNVALVGHSGCGKSTMIGLLMRYYQQEQGTITVDGVAVDRLNVEWLRSKIGIVSQEPVLFQTTVLENLQMGNKAASRSDVEQACKTANAHEFITKLQGGYDTRIGDGGIRLSGGQKQRIAIARALLKKPKILLLDEATSALDTESERIVQEALDKAAKNRTTVTIAHRLSTVKNADKIIVFDQGTIIESGTHEKLFHDVNSYYRQLVLAQQVAGKKEPVDNLELDEEVGLLKTQLSDRMRNSIANVRDNYDAGVYVEDAQDDLKVEGTVQASVLDILKFGKSELKYAVLGFVLSLVRGCSWPLFSLIYGQLFMTMSLPDREEAQSKAMMNSLSFAAIGLFGGIATFASGLCLGSYGEKISMKLRVAVYKNLLRQDSSFFDSPHHSVGVLTARLSQDASNVQAAIDQRLAEVLQGLTALVVGVGIAFSFGWNFAPFCICLAVLLVITQTSISSYLKKRGAKDAEIAGAASKIVTESIEYVKTVQALTRQKEIFEEFKIASELPHKRAIVRGLFQSLSYAISGSYIPFNFCASYTFGMWLILNDYAQPFTIFQVIEALNMAAFLISASASYFPEYIKAKISAGLMFRIMKTTPKIDNLAESGVMAPIRGNIEIQNVRFAYPNGGKFLTLNGLNIQARFGQTIALVGPSGCGKSTVIQLMERFYDVSGGAVRVDGAEMTTMNVRHLRNSIALVGQEPTLFNLTIKENISYGLEDATFEAVQDAARLANIDKFVESLPQGYETMVGGRGSQLSGGQKQRIAIARAMIRKPKILLLDEATAALDSESEKLVQEALDKAKSGRTCIVVAHRLSTIQNSDVIYVLQNGKCIESGDHQKLLERAGLYYNLVKSQNMS